MSIERVIDLQKHTAKLSQLFVEDDFYPKFMPTNEWLDIAASVNNVQVSTGQDDSGLMLCGQALTYESKRSELLSQFVTQLSIFNFIWGAYESFIKSIALPLVPENIISKGGGRGNIINKTCWHLYKNTDGIGTIPFYSQTIKTLEKLINSDRYYYEKYKNNFTTNELIDENGIGINVVRNIRNDLAHGSASMPTPDKWTRGYFSLNNYEKRHPQLIKTSSRIILLTMQMLLLTFVTGKEKMIEIYSIEKEKYRKISLERFIGTIHLATDFRYM